MLSALRLVCYSLVYQMVTSREIEQDESRDAPRVRPASAPRAPARRKLQAPQRRQLIEQAAARLFAQRGFQATTVAQICAAAGVSKPMLYRHFESKQELQVRLLERRRDELAAAPIARFMETDGPVEERLAAMIDAATCGVALVAWLCATDSWNILWRPIL